ncbi:MAG: 30S ribosomal protein S1 [Deltaproteobacteria bacterium]|jgi:small subunit ribosomal protein S1|nr:30S ribosomal protein S1 [Deltaproteobacteria bacterium]
MADKFSDFESFSDLLKDNDLSKKELAPGEKIEAIVVDVTQDSIFLDVGGKSEGYVDRKELEDEEGNISVKAGDSLVVYFLSGAHNEMLFTTKIGGGSSSRAHLEEAYRSSIPIEGFVQKEIKGGFEVTVAGKIRTFCPFSQMEIKRISEPDKYIGRHLLFKITKYGEEGRNIVLSRRIILEEEREEKREQLKDSLQEGMTVKGTITSIRDFGAFVDIDEAIEGLIPVSEIGWSRIDNIKDILSEGQNVEVVILKLDWENDRFSFSLKQALPDPWLTISQKAPVGSFHTGTVVRLAKFGAFVNIAEGIDGLIHISKLGGGRRINHPREVLEEGQNIDVKIDDIDTEQKRIALSLVSEEPEEDSEVTGKPDDYAEYMKQTAPAQSRKGSRSTLGDLLEAKLKEKEGKK